jgi:hypothetical protein
VSCYEDDMSSFFLVSLIFFDGYPPAEVGFFVVFNIQPEEDEPKMRKKQRGLFIILHAEFRSCR